MVVNSSAVAPIEFEGLQIFDYTSGVNISSSLAKIKVGPGRGHRKARSERSDKYYYVLNGIVLFTIEGKEYRLEGADFCLVQQGQSFSYENSSDEDATLLLLHTPSFDLDAETFLDCASSIR